MKGDFALFIIISVVINPLPPNDEITRKRGSKCRVCLQYNYKQSQNQSVIKAYTKENYLFSCKNDGSHSTGSSFSVK